jgi:hypothetical protein
MPSKAKLSPQPPPPTTARPLSTTLELRSFFRHLTDETDCSDYYGYLRQEISREELFRRYPAAASAARTETWCFRLGRQPEKSDERIGEATGRIRTPGSS